MLWNFGELTSTISTTIRQQKVPGHAEVPGKKAMTNFDGRGAHLLLWRRWRWQPRKELVGDLSRHVGGALDYRIADLLGICLLPGSPNFPVCFLSRGGKGGFSINPI